MPVKINIFNEMNVLQKRVKTYMESQIIDVSVTASLCITATLNLGEVSSCSHTATLRAGNLTVQVQSCQVSYICTDLPFVE